MNKIFELRKAESSKLFNIKSGVYIWYYPIHIKHYDKNIDDSLADYFSKDYKDYCEITRKEIHDPLKREKAIVESTQERLVYNLKFNDHKYSTRSKTKFFDSFLTMSILGNPLYIGKSERDTSISERINDHLSYKTDFSKTLKKALKSNITLNDMLILAINVDEVFSKEIINHLNPEVNKALFLEKLLINLLSPKYNIKK